MVPDVRRPDPRDARAMTKTQARREERQMMPRAFALVDPAPERACAVMAAELDALGRDIAAARRRVSEPPRRPRRARVAPPDGEAVVLGRGGAVVIRPIRPDDASRLRSAFARLGALTRLRRFLRPLTGLSSHQLAYLTRVDHVDHEALVGLDPRTGEIVGVARYLREGGDRHRARLAVVVVDDWQGRGVGGALVERLSARARANGVQTFCGATIGGNQAARGLMRHASVTLADEWEAGMSELTGQLAPPPAARRWFAWPVAAGTRAGP
jgi:GNAT superfamily N-acetyltransferase